ncbi:MAG: DNA polymerase I [Chloroflexota bacterium]|jgi:DNA polymerase-1
MAGKIALIDGNALVHRAFHALPPMSSPKGELTNATYGVASMLLKVLQEMRPEYAVAAFDTPAPTFRHVEYEAYKAHRGPAPEGLHEQFGRVHQLLEAMGIPIYRVDGFEADDLLGTLSRQAVEMGLEVVIVTGDTDALQLVGPNVTVLTSRRGFSDTVLYDVEGVKDRYGVSPSQLVDVKALKGDASDNIPGVPGIGEKTAVRLVAEYGSLDRIYEHLDSLSGRLKQQLESNREQAFFSRRLAQIVLDVPVHLELEGARVGASDRARLAELFRELGFKSLMDRLPREWGQGGESVSTDNDTVQGVLFSTEQQAQTPSSTEETGDTSPLVASEGANGSAPTGEKDCSYHIITDHKGLKQLVETLGRSPIFAIDLETTGKDPLQADLVGFSFSTQPGVAYYIPVGHRLPNERGLALLLTDNGHETSAEEDYAQLPLDEVLMRLKPVLEDERVHKCAHNGKYDMLVLSRYGIELRGLVFDTIVAAYLLEGTQRSLGLKELAWTRLNVEMESYADLAGKGKAAVTLDQLPIQRVANYSCSDADMTLRLKENLEPELKATDLQSLFERIEMPLVPVLASMEKTGVALDVDYLKELSRELYQRICELEVNIHEAAGHSFNVASTQQLATVLFQELKLPPIRKTKTGYSTDADVLDELRGTHPIIEMILEYRQMVKLKSTYVDALPLLVNPRTRRVHTSFNQTIASTGRLSSSDPNLQNIPIRTEMGRRVRKAFVAADESWMLLSADYSQIELRVLAHMSGDSTLVDAFLRGDDIHAATAAQVYGIPISDVTSTERRIAKTVNFGVLYGMSDYGLSRDTGLSRKEASLFIENYFNRYGAVKEFFETIKRDAENNGYVSTLLGRRRYIPEIRAKHRQLRQAAERMAVNMPIQGTAADIIKIAMINLDRYLADKGLRSRMILQVHDELLFECPREELEPLAYEVKRIMESAMVMRVPLVVELKRGSNWDEMGRMVL